MNSIKLTFEEYINFQSEVNNPFFKGERPISMKLKANGIKAHGSGLYITDDGTGIIVSDEPLKNPPPAPKREIISMDKGPSLEELRKEVIKEWKKSRIGISSTLTPKQWEDLFDDREVDKTEVMNIFNELLGAWVANSKTLVGLHPGSQIEWALETNEIDKKKEVYERRFKEALGVE